MSQDTDRLVYPCVGRDTGGNWHIALLGHKLIVIKYTNNSVNEAKIKKTTGVLFGITLASRHLKEQNADLFKEFEMLLKAPHSTSLKH